VVIRSTSALKTYDYSEEGKVKVYKNGLEVDNFVHLEEIVDFPLNAPIEHNQESFQVVKQMSK